MKERLIAFLLPAVICGCSTQQGPLSIYVEMVNQHPFLVDHERVLVATVGDSKIGTAPLYGDPGAGSPLHYVRSEDAITVVDANGMWYEVTRKGIRPLGWEWSKPLPEGEVRRIALNENHMYVDTAVGSVQLNSIYKYKDPPHVEK